MAGIVALPLGERAEARRVVVHEHRPDQLLLDQVLEEFVDEHVVGLRHSRSAPGHFDIECDILGPRGGANRDLVGHVAADVLAEQVAVLRALPRRCEVHGLVAVRDMESHRSRMMLLPPSSYFRRSTTAVGPIASTHATISPSVRSIMPR